jgi:IMP dehydrogenase
MERIHYKALRHAYGFDDVALVPGDITINPDQTDITLAVDRLSFPIPVMASAMDGVVDVRFAIALGKLGGLAVLNLEGLQTRYEDPDPVLAEIAGAVPDKVTALMQRVYSEPIKENLVGKRIKAVKDGGVVCCASLTPANTKRLSPVAAEAGMDILVVQSTVTTARHISKSYRGLIFSELIKQLPVPVIVGNCVSYSACRKLMETGIHGVLVGVGPGAACTTREVLGVGVPQVTATMDSAAARDDYYRSTGRYVPIVTDGGFRNGGDICKALAAGADAVMLGSIFAQTAEAPGRGNHWGMATPHEALPRGTRVKVGIKGTLEQILFGPTSLTDGTQNLVGALRTAMGVCGARNIREMHQTEVVIAPAIKTEGKHFQLAQRC